jgi:hypothetical protein
MHPFAMGNAKIRSRGFLQGLSGLFGWFHLASFMLKIKKVGLCSRPTFETAAKN